MTATTEHRTPTSGPEPDGRRSSVRTQVLISAVVLFLLAGASLILLMTITGGDEVEVAEEDVTTLTQMEVTDTLLRTGEGPGDLELEGLYTPRWYFSWSGRPEPTTDSPTLAFFVFETTHKDDLPVDPPAVTIESASGSFVPYDVVEVTDSPHHRVSQFLFPAVDANEAWVVGDDESLVVRATWPDGTSETLRWERPLPFGLGALSAPAEADPGTTFTFQSPALSFGAIAVIFTGMLAALSPCLLMLAAYYTAVLSGTAAASADGPSRASAERRLLLTGLFFVVGFTAVYTAGGVVAGYIGESVGRFDSIAGWSKPISIAAGVVVILMGIRMASQANVPVVCKLPGFNRPTESGWFGSAVMGTTFAVGCLSCFSATVLTALLLYAGATGSPISGGLVMLMFSAGVGVMFLVASLLVARAAPVTTWLTKAQPVIGVLSSLIMIALGLLMVTYRFHLFTGWLFELWN